VRIKLNGAVELLGLVCGHHILYWLPSALRSHRHHDLYGEETLVLYTPSSHSSLWNAKPSGSVGAIRLASNTFFCAGFLAKIALNKNARDPRIVKGRDDAAGG